MLHFKTPLKWQEAYRSPRTEQWRGEGKEKKKKIEKTMSSNIFKEGEMMIDILAKHRNMELKWEEGY